MSEYQIIEPGDIIISSPYADTGIIFSKSVIYIVSHDHTGTSGVIINKVLNKVDSQTITKVLNLENQDHKIIGSLPVYFGGPVEQEKGILLHSSDYNKNSLKCGDEEILINIDTEVFQDIVSGVGPLHNMFVLGHTSWAPNQLLAEIKRDDWLLPVNNLSKREIYELVFLEEYHSRWSKALGMTGVTLSNYSNLAGNA